VCQTEALPFTFKGILRQKKNYGKLKYFTIQKYIIFKKTPLEKETKNPSRYYYDKLYSN
jgi:hypothetical protein